MQDRLDMRTVVYEGDVDQMGVVVHDDGGECVRVDFGDGAATGARGWCVGTHVPRGKLEDVTDTYDLARKWGYINEGEGE
ncbi:hypothetical protein ABT282_07355 [Streptomyces sp. NPDC000927]|uniref:hypothetical protein n=1 Tax=Streptomyces sp. NPDC000927 TaxID=3154371 RepID=UPI00332FBBA7